MAHAWLSRYRALAFGAVSYAVVVMFGAGGRGHSLGLPVSLPCPTLYAPPYPAYSEPR
ncbi:hypothetical protein [uncultured Duncaniella sp.]|uniref:hypothetical protein n=1 Tax=uncultured Duncaniella sp. TaxID=2768039 RepID=UPI0026754264|nr:hypothetical protein [uncultured Duncaniella sp.]MCI9172003.1 hypothetical protein [Muribaculaceae bacterium]